MEEIILEAGDTDTNAAIVGGLLGSLIGFSCLPGEYIEKMMELVFSDRKEGEVESSLQRGHKYEPFEMLLSSLSLI